MLYYHADVSSPCFPRHNGHRAWPYYAETVDGAAIEDLFWRKVQVSPHFTAEVVRTVWPDANLCKQNVFIAPNLYVSLLPESCGAYTIGGRGGLYPLRGDAADMKRIEMGMQPSLLAGYYLGSPAVLNTGWVRKNVVPNILRAMKLELSASDRFRFHEKAGYKQVLLTDPNKNEDDYTAIINRAYPLLYNFSTWMVYWYKTERGDINFGIVYYFDSKGNVYKLPLSAWVANTDVLERRVYDTLNIAPPYPPYDLDKLVRYGNSQTVLICDSEEAVEYLKRKHGWIPHCIPVTTYISIEATDWSTLRGKTPIIFPEATKEGCLEAFRLYATLEKQGVKSLFQKRQKGGRLESQECIQDICNLAFHGSECSLPEFAEHCQREFGVKPPDGILPKAVPLSSLPEPAIAPEILMDGLLDTGEQMMIHAWRGVGKSLFALLLALCFASGKSALNGRVCPSRKHHVLLLDGEMSGHNLRKRARGLCCGHELPLDAMDAVKVRSPILEGKDLNLESDAGFAKLEPDMMAADTIIVDSVFKFFPTAMNSEFAGAEKMLGFLDWCRRQGKTLILIDHEGKGRETSFGTMAKEIGLDVVLRLGRAKSGNWIQALVQKARDHAEPTEAYLEMRIETSEKGENIAFQVRDEHKVVSAHRGDGEAESTGYSEEKALSIDEAIIKYVREHPDAPQKEIADALIEKKYGKRSTIQARIKTLSEAGKLPNWKNRPETHKVAEPPAPEVDEK